MSDWHQEVQSASQGDARAIAALMERHLPRLRAFVRLHMGPQLRAKESASDLVQSACHEVLRSLHRYRHQSEAAFRQWLFTTALRKVRDRVDYWQAEKRDVAREAVADDTRALEALSLAYGHVDTPSAQLDAKERVARLEAALDRLLPQHREVIVLARIVGLPHREIAAALGRSELACRTLLYRALAELAAALDEPPR